MRQVRHQLRRRLIQHSHLRPVWRHPLVGQPPQAAVAEDFVELILLDLLPEIGPFLDPRRALDYPAIHIRNIQGAVWCVGDAHRPEQRIE